MTPPNVDTRVGLDLLVEDLLSAALRDVHERWERRLARVLEFDREQLMVLMERRCSGPRDAFARDLGPRAAETVPDIQDVPPLADRLRADHFQFWTGVQADPRHAPPRPGTRPGPDTPT